MKRNLRERLSVASRITAGAVGGYVLTSLITVVLFLLLRAQGMTRDEALLAPTIASFVLYAAIIMAVFHARSAAKAWLWLIGLSIPVGLLLLMMMRAGNGA